VYVAWYSRLAMEVLQWELLASPSLAVTPPKLGKVEPLPQAGAGDGARRPGRSCGEVVAL
jgi:hypothetical protein